MLAAGCALVAALALSPAGTRADTVTEAYTVSGVRVLHRRLPGDVVAARLYLLGGTRQLTLSNAGIEQLVLEASAHGTVSFPGDETARAMARTGSQVTLSAESDWTVAGLVGLKEEFEPAWRVLADRVARPALTDEAVERARSRLLARARQRYAVPGQRIWMLAARSRFVGHPYALDPEGTEFSLTDLTPEQVRAYHREQTVTSRMLLVIVGDLPRADVERLVTATLGGLSAGSYAWTLPPAPPQRDSRWLIERDSLPTNYILGYFAGPSPRSKEYPAFMVATSILSGAVNARVRQRQGLSYASYAPFLQRGVGVAGVYASTSDPEEVVRILQEAIMTLSAANFSQSSFAGSREAMALNELRSSIGAAEQAERLGRAELYYGDWRRASGDMHRLRGVTGSQVTNAVRLYFQRVSYAYIGDPKLIKMDR